MIFDGLVKNVNNKGEGSCTPTEPHHTPSPEAQPPSPTTHSSSSLPPVTTTIPTVIPSKTTPIRQYTQRAKIAQSSTIPTVADEHESPLRDIIPRVTSPAAAEGSMQQTINELMALCTSLQRQYSELAVKFEAQGIEITRLKARLKLLEDRQGVAVEGYGDDAPIKGRSLDEREAAAERTSDDIEEMETVLTSMDAAIVLASGAAEVPTGSGYIPTAGPPAAEVPTGSGYIPTAGPPAAEVPTGSDVVPTASLVFATAIVVTPQRRRKGKEVMVESDTPKKQKEYHQFASELYNERRIELISDMVKYQDNYTKVHKFQSQQRKPWTKKQKRDYYLAVIKSNLGWKVKDFRGMTFKEVKAKFNLVWKQMEDFIPMGSNKEDHRRSAQIARDAEITRIYVEEELQLMIDGLDRTNEIVKDFRGMTFEEVKAKFNSDWKQIEDFIPMGSKEEPERIKRKEKDYPLRKGLALVMISYKLQVENYSQMANELVLKIYKIANSPRQQGIEFPLAEEVPTASEEGCHCQKKRDATARKIALLIKSRRNCQSKSNDSFTNSKSLDHTFDKLQKLVSQLELLGKVISQEDINIKFLRSLLSEWGMHVVVWRNKPDLNTLSMDDFYNNLKVYESEVKGISSSTNTQNMAFVSSFLNNSNNSNGVNTANEVNTANSQVNAASSLNIDNLSEAVICAFLASQPNITHHVNEDLEHIYPDNLEEIYLKWQIAMLTMRARRFLKNRRRKLNLNGNDSVAFDKTKVECYNYHKRSHFARECRALRRHDNRSRDVTRKTVPVKTPNSLALVSCDRLGGYDWSDQAEEGTTNYALMAYSTSSDLSSDSECQIIDNCIKGLGYNAVPPPHIGLFPPPKSDLSYTGLEELFNEPKTEKSKDKCNDVEPKSVRKGNDAPIVEDWVSDVEEV
nr:hypothetical protein [Tanacetum cinerariifolium]